MTGKPSSPKRGVETVEKAGAISPKRSKPRRHDVIRDCPAQQPGGRVAEPVVALPVAAPLWPGSTMMLGVVPSPLESAVVEPVPAGQPGRAPAVDEVPGVVPGMAFPLTAGRFLGICEWRMANGE